MEPTFSVSEAWKQRCPGSSGGVLAVTGFAPNRRHPQFDESLTATEEELRHRFSEMPREEIRQTGNLAHYHRYYRSFGQNYHVQHQIESIAKKGRKIPRRQLLVEIAFKWELEHGLLTGIHDLDQLEPPVVLDAAVEQVAYTLYSGEEATVKGGDMFFRDQRGVLSSVILGPAEYGRVSEETSGALVTVYGAPGVPGADIALHLQAIWSDIVLVAPSAQLFGLTTQSS